MRKLILSTGLCMTALTALVFVVYQVAAEPDAQGGAATGESSPISERRAKVAAGANANARLSLDLIPNGGAGDQRDNEVTSGTASGRDTIAIEVFATGVTTSLIGMQLQFAFDATLLTFVKAENRAFVFNVPQPTGTDFAAFSPVRLASSGFLARAEFTTAADVTGREFSIGLGLVTLSESLSSSDTLTTTSRISFNVPTTSTPDFNGNGKVDFPDFLAFVAQYGARRGDSRYQAKYDLNSDGAIDFQDFLTFASSYGKSVPPSGGGSRSPDLVVEAPSVSNSTLTPGQSFTLQATVRNRGTGPSAATTLRYHQSSDATITTSDRSVGTDAVSVLSASGTGLESIPLTAPLTPGTYYYGACVAAVSNEKDTSNNCSTGVRVTVGGGGGGGGGSRSPDLLVESPSVSDSTLTPGQSFTLQATVRNRGTGPSTATTLRYHQSSDATITTSDRSVGTDAVSVLSASGTGLESILLTAPLSAGTYYYGACVAAVSGETDVSNNCSTGIRVVVGAPDLVVQSASVDNTTLTPGQSLTLSAKVHNQGMAEAAATTLRYYRSTDATITTGDTEVGSDSVNRLAARNGLDTSVRLTAPAATGTYYYGACVVAVIGEKDTSNNCSAGVQVIVGAPGLLVQSLTASNTTPTPGQSITLRATVGNRGTAAATAATLRYYQSSDATITTGDTEVGTADVISTLAVGATSVQSSSVTTPATAGTYYYGACVVAVRGSSDNCSAGVRVVVGAPDLLVQSPSVDNTTPTAGQSITLRATVLNRGTATAAATTLRYYLSADATITTGDTEVGTADAISALAVSATSEQSSSVPVSAIPGTYYYGACVASVSNEKDTSNNCSASVRVTVGAPDLVVQSPSVDKTTAAAAQSLTLSATVLNRGTGAAAATTLRYYLSADATITTDDTPVGTDAVSALAVSATSVQSSSVPVAAIPGTYYYGACVDAVSGESNTTNNCSTGVRVTVGTPDLLVQSASVDNTTLTPGQAFTLRATVLNRGTASAATTTLRYYQSSDATITTGDTEVGTADAISALAVSATSEQSSRVTAPATAGTYYYGACVASIGESNTDNNCSTGVQVIVGAPGLLVQSVSVDDTTPTPGQAITLRATVGNRGTAAATAATLRYYQSSDATITTGDTEVGTSDAISALAVSATSEQSSNVTAPLTAGTYYYGACVLVRGLSDNCSAGVRVVVGAPDLLVQSPAVDNTTPTTGQAFTLSATVFNRGTAEVAAATLRYYRSTDATITTGDTEVGSSDAISVLAVSAKSVQSSSVTAPSTTGTYYYGACVDAVSGETDVSNNCSAGVQVTVGAPDLLVQSPAVDKTTATPGQVLTLRATVRNQGTATATATTLRYYQSSDATITTSDTQVGTADAISALAASATSEQSSSVTAPAAVGTYYFGACVASVSAESATNNNCSDGVRVMVVVPDLIVESPSVDDTTPTPEQSITLRATVRNQGTGQAATTTLRYYRSTNATITTGDTEVGSSDAISALAASETSEQSSSVTAPTTAGTYYYGACVASVSGETDVSNNCSDGVQVTVGAPDLVVQSPSVNDTTPTPGQSITLSATVRNQGTAEAAATTLRYYQSSDATITTDDTEVGTADAISALAASATSEQSSSVTAPATAGTYYYGACVESVSAETDVSNNCSAGVQVTVGAPDLLVQSPSVDDTTPTPGQSLALSATVRNQGTAEAAATTLRYYQSSDATITTGDTEVGSSDAISALAASATSEQSSSVTAPATAGTYYYGACVASVSGETDVSNNCSAGVQVTVGAPDLVVQSPSVDNTTPTPGQSLTLSATVRNQGTAEAAATTLRYYQSSDATITTGDTEVGTSDAISALAASATSEQSSSVTAPATAGTYYYGACVVAVSGETDVSNNCSAGVQVTVGAPDLVVQSPSVDNTTPTPGQSLTLSATVRNQGTAEAAATTLRYYQSSDATITTDDTEVGSSDAISALAASATSEQSSSVTAPATAGTYYYGACVASVSGETDVSNNCSAGVQVTVGAPDLLVQSPSVDDTTPTPGQSITLRATVRNQGTAEAAATTLRYYQSSDATITTGDTEVGSSDAISALAASATSEQSSSVTAPATAGTYYYGACVASVSAETDVSNNCSASVQVTVGAPDLVVQSPSVNDTTPTPGQSLTLSATVRNQGTAEAAATTLRYYQSSDATITTDDTEVGSSDAISALAASATSEQSSSVTASATAGTYYYGACVASVSGETDVSNNCSASVQVTVGAPDLVVQSPSVDDTTPTPGQSLTLSATVRNQGTAEAAATTLRYYQSSDATITTDDTEVGSSNAISALAAATATSEQSSSVTAPSTAGTYYYGACVASVSNETDTNNNCSAGVQVTVGIPDLVVQSPSVSDTTRAPGESLTLSATVRNQGTGASAATTLRYYQSSNATITTDDTEVGSSDAISALAASATSAQSSSVTAPTTSGTYYYGVCVDAVTGESNTNNNCSAGVRVTVKSKMYWTDYHSSRPKIQRANLDGSNVEDLITTGLIVPWGIALDVGRGKMYWMDYGTDKIQRANLDGSNVEDLITTGLRRPQGIALDVGRGKMYWVDRDADKIQRANLNGSNVEDLITTGLSGPNVIALDVGRGKMYWTEYHSLPSPPYTFTSKIQRANLDGSNVEELITLGIELRAPVGIALDVGRGKMYWTDSSTDTIRRANLDGSNVEDLITTGLSAPSGIALDVGRGKMYWMDHDTDKIQRANLNGSNVEDLITTGLSAPVGIALDLR